jgi:hypothetical protein
MNAAGNVIPFRRHDGAFSAAPAEAAYEAMTDEEEMSFLARARHVLDEIEATWEEDHSRPELRDKFHLLRYYLKRFPEQRRGEEAALILKEE